MVSITRNRLLAIGLVLCIAATASAGDPDDILLFNAQSGSPLAGQWSLTYVPEAPNTFSPTKYDGGQVIYNISTTGWTPQPNIPLTGDVTGDGISDLVAIARNSSNNQPNFFVNETEETSPGSGVGVLNNGSADFWKGTNITATDFFMGDINGDGLMDAVDVKPGSPKNQWTAYTSQGSDLLGPRSWAFVERETPLMGDFNGDGIDDIGVRGSGGDLPSGYIKTYLSSVDGLQNGGDAGTHDGYQVAEIVQGSVADQPNHIDTLVGDINGDGIDDIVEVDDRAGTGNWTWVAGLTGASGAASGYSIKAGGLSWNTIFNPDPSITVRVPLLGDMNGDGFDDIVEYREFPNTGGNPGDMFGQFLIAFTDPGTGDFFNSSFDGQITFALSADQAGNIPMLGQFTPEPSSLVLLALGGIGLLRRQHG